MLKCHLFLEWQSFSGQFDEYKDKIYLFKKKKKLWQCKSVYFHFKVLFFLFTLTLKLYINFFKKNKKNKWKTISEPNLLNS